MTKNPRPDNLSIANWREPRFSRWSFQHVRELIPTAQIRAASPMKAPHTEPSLDVGAMSVRLAKGNSVGFHPFLIDSATTGLTLLKDGKTLLNWVAPDCGLNQPHLLFSVSKSITGLLVGILVGLGKIGPDDRVTDYLPELAGSAYGDECTVRHLLDMTVSLDFTEDYNNPESAFGRYRRAMIWNPVDMTKPNLNLLTFAQSLLRLPRPHGQAFFYASPTSDVLGMVAERAGGNSFAHLVSELLWAKMDAGSDAYVTVDGAGYARAAGGICVTVGDLARLGEMVRNQGRVDGHQIVPEDWVADMWSGGDREIWRKSGSSLLPNGQYRSQWYRVGDNNNCLCAIGIHGQWIYIDPVQKVVIAKTSAQAIPVDDDLDRDCLSVFSDLAEYAGSL